MNTTAPLLSTVPALAGVPAVSLFLVQGRTILRTFEGPVRGFVARELVGVAPGVPHVHGPGCRG